MTFGIEGLLGAESATDKKGIEMIKNKLTAIVAASVMMASTPAIGQTAPTAVQPQTEQVAGSAQFDEWGTEAYIIAGIIVILLIWGAIEIFGDGDEEVISPE
ncbi:MAG TPA: hypothetical protein VGW34_02090 [Allosphingosinicella sp.]|nr:hypothetical protein [Allosphingosinicella sp.]